MSSITLEAWQVISLFIGLLIAFFGFVAAGGKLLLSQFEKRLDEQFKAQQKGREETQKHWDAQFDSLKRNSSDESKQLRQVERDLMNLKAELPLSYVFREDYIRQQSILEAKLDGLALSIQNALIKG